MLLSVAELVVRAHCSEHFFLKGVPTGIFSLLHFYVCDSCIADCCSCSGFCCSLNNRGFSRIIDTSSCLMTCWLLPNQVVEIGMCVWCFITMCRTVSIWWEEQFFYLKVPSYGCHSITKWLRSNYSQRDLRPTTSLQSDRSRELPTSSNKNYGSRKCGSHAVGRS